MNSCGPHLIRTKVLGHSAGLSDVLSIDMYFEIFKFDSHSCRKLFANVFVERNHAPYGQLPVIAI